MSAQIWKSMFQRRQIAVDWANRVSSSDEYLRMYWSEYDKDVALFWLVILGFLNSGVFIAYAVPILHQPVRRCGGRMRHIVIPAAILPSALVGIWISLDVIGTWINDLAQSPRENQRAAMMLNTGFLLIIASTTAAIILQHRLNTSVLNKTILVAGISAALVYGVVDPVFTAGVSVRSAGRHLIYEPLPGAGLWFACAVWHIFIASGIRWRLRFCNRDEPLCQECGYDLRGLVEHVCPECGRTFSIA